MPSEASIPEELIGASRTLSAAVSWLARLSRQIPFCRWRHCIGGFVSGFGTLLVTDFTGASAIATTAGSFEGVFLMGSTFAALLTTSGGTAGTGWW